jgi:hypothetical protein
LYLLSVVPYIDEQSESKSSEGRRSKRFGLAKTWLASQARWPNPLY